MPFEILPPKVEKTKDNSTFIDIHEIFIRDICYQSQNKTLINLCYFYPKKITRKDNIIGS